MIYTVSKDRNDGVGFTLCEKLNVNMPIVFVSLQEDLNFNEQVLSLAGQKYCLVNFTEMGYDWDRKESHIWGQNTQNFPNVFHYDKWGVFDNFVKDNPPAITFSRELLQADVSPTLQPISYPCFISPIPIQSKDEFLRRAFDVFFSFGISHEYRKELHGSIWANSGKYGYSVCDNLYTMQLFLEKESNPRKWVSIHIPWWARQPNEVIVERNGWSRISISVAGAGRNCFRHLESPCNSAMLMWDDNTAWHQKDWEHGFNCLKCEQGKEIETCIEWLQNPDELYNIYVNGVNTVGRFRFDTYVPYLENLINKA